MVKMEKFLIYLVAGFAGGIIRGLVGFVKNKVIEKADHFKPQYFLITILISGIVGAAAGALADTEWQVSFLAGYAGTDFIESLYKIKLSQKIGKFSDEITPRSSLKIFARLSSTVLATDFLCLARYIPCMFG